MRFPVGMDRFPRRQRFPGRFLRPDKGSSPAARDMRLTGVVSVISAVSVVSFAPEILHRFLHTASFVPSLSPEGRSPRPSQHGPEPDRFAKPIQRVPAPAE